MADLQKDMVRVQALAHESYLATGGVMALLDSDPVEPVRLAEAMDKTAGKLEAATVELRNLCERHRPRYDAHYRKRCAPPPMDLAGSASITEHGWLHLELATLLPHCTREPPAYLSDTIRRLLDGLEAQGATLPWYREALLVIDEHCEYHNRNVYDQDNKGWKAVPNALKGRLFEDDDQFTLSVCLLATRAEVPRCHIFLLPLADADDYFYMRAGRYPFF